MAKRFFCTEVPKKWPVKQVTKGNFSDSLEELKRHISGSDYVAVSLQKTGSFSAPWHRVLAFDTAETTYYKAKYAAERFQLLQFAVCPFTIRASKLIAHPYNYLLFPRDELRLGMPSYSFSCQTSYLTSMAREGFDFNACIYDGISYLSRVQESSAKVQIGNPLPSTLLGNSTSSPSVADSVFVERIKSRVANWKNGSKKSKEKSNDALLNSLRKLVLGSEYHGTRPCINIDVCSDRQVQLVLEMLKEYSDELVPLIVPARSGGAQAIRVVLTSSKEDRDLFERELQCLEDEENKKIRGFREVIDLISASQKPVVSYNSLTDFAFVHSKFLAPLPPSIDEFASSLCLVFPNVLDVSHMVKVIGHLEKKNNLPFAISHLKNHFFAPVDIEISHQVTENDGRSHGDDVVKICHLFAKLCSILKISHHGTTTDNKLLAQALEEYANTFNPLSISSQESIDEDIGVWTKNTRKVSSKQLVFLWGFRHGMTAGKLKTLLHGSHPVFSKEFDIRLVDKSCAIVVLWQPGLSKTFLEVMKGEGISGSLREMVSEGLRAVSYETYKRVCRLGIREPCLGESFDKALEELDLLNEAESEAAPREIYWSSSDSMINLDEL